MNIERGRSRRYTHLVPARGVWAATQANTGQRGPAQANTGQTGAPANPSR